MAFTDPALPGVESPAEPPRPASLRKRALIVGVALVGASAITASPATAAVPALASAKAYEVQLAAAVDPLATWQSTFETAFGHIQYGLNEMGTLYPALAQDLLQAAPALFQEFGGMLTNVGGWQQVMNNLPGYAERIQAAIEASQEAGDIPDDIPTFDEMIQNVSGYLQNYEFNNAFAEFNQYFLWSAGGGAWPLLRELTIGTEILQTVGAYRLASAWDALFVGPDGQGGAVTDFTMFVFGPVVTAAMAFTESLDDVAAAAIDNDWENAVAELLNIAPNTLNAYLNGHNPRVSGFDWDWAGALTNKGTLEYFLFTLPRELTWGLLNPLVPEESEATALTGLPEAASTRLAAMKNLLNLDLGALVPGAESDEDVAESGTVVEKVIDKIVNGEETVEGEETAETVAGEETAETVDGEETTETVDGEETTDSETAPVVTKPVEETAPVKETTPVEGVVEETPVLQDKAETPAESAKTGLDNTKNKIRSIRNKLADRFGGKGDSSKPSSSKPGSGSSDSDSSESKSDKSDSGKTESGSSTDKSKSDSKSGSDSAKSSSSKSSSGSDSKSDRGSDSKRKSKSSDSD